MITFLMALYTLLILLNASILTMALKDRFKAGSGAAKHSQDNSEDALPTGYKVLYINTSGDNE